MERDDWQVGDLALCVFAGVRRGDCGAPLRSIRVGGLYTVGTVGIDFADNGAILALVGIVAETETRAFCASRFRKIHPHAPDAEDAETIALLTGKPATVTA